MLKVIEKEGCMCVCVCENVSQKLDKKQSEKQMPRRKLMNKQVFVSNFGNGRTT